MSYCSRVYNHRNSHSQDESAKEPFFSKQNDINKQGQKNAFFQAKLSVNEPGDRYEREADSVANAVVNNKTAAPVLQQKKISSIQRLATSMEDEKLSTNDARMARDKEIQEKPIQKMDDPLKEDDKKKPNPIQRKQGTGTNPAPTHVSSKIENSSGKGNALTQKTLTEMSSSFGVDFGNVRVHDDSDAVNMNKELNAQAFTHGRDIYFNKGKYNPENSEGKFLLAHELTHVVQQDSSMQTKTIQRTVIDRNVVTNDAILTSLGLSREEIIEAITSADDDAIVLAQNAEDTLTAQLEIARSGGIVDPDSELILNEELGISYNNPVHHGLIRQQISRFKRVRETLESGYLKYLSLGIGNVGLIGCKVDNCGPSFAFSCPGNRLIVLCQAFWDNSDQQSATVLHEPFHIWFQMAGHEANLLRRADASCFESFALRASGRSAFASCDKHTSG